MKAKDVHKFLQTAPWLSDADVQTFVAGVEEFPGPEQARALPLLVDKRLVADARVHRLRCLAFAALVERAPDPELFVPLVKAVRSGDPVFRETAARLLPICNNVSRHSDLCDLMAAPEPEVRKVAAVVLQRVGGQSALQFLIARASEKGFAGRVEAMDVFVAKAAHHALPLLAQVLHSGEPNERIHALKYLGNPKLMAKDPASAVKVIALAFETSDARVVSVALAALSQVASEDEFFAIIGAQRDTSNIPRLKAIIESVTSYKSERTIDFLGRKFRAGPTAIRLAVIDALGQIGTDHVLPVLLEAMSHKRIDVRTHAAEVVAKLGTSGRVDVARIVLWLLRSRDANVRRLAAEVVQRVGDPDGTLAPKLLRFLRDEDWWVRERIMDGLVEFAGASLTRHLLEFLKDPNEIVRRFAIGGIMRVNDPRAVGALVQTAMNDSDWWVREQAIEALAKLNDKRVVPYLLEVLDRHATERLACIKALTALGDPAASPRITPFLSDEEPEVRLASIEAISVFNDRNAAPALQKLEDDPAVSVRNAAREVLTKWSLFKGTSAEKGAASLGLLDRMLVAAVHTGADDLILAVDRTPYVKQMGKIIPLSKSVLTKEHIEVCLLPHLSAAQISMLEKTQDVDFSYEVKAYGLRFRGHVFQQSVGLSGVFRLVRNEIPDISKLALPQIVSSFGNYKNGLVLVGGPTGSGKSTTLAALIDYINRTSARHIVTIEDPIEVVHTRQQSLINQREVGTHTRSFTAALRATLRQDPDVILVGELRDLPTIQFAVSAAETGHLVFGTVHTVSADTSIDRLVNAFPSGQQAQVRAMLSDTLRAVLCQHLLRTPDQKGRVVAAEVMINNDAVANLIRKAKTFQIPSVIATSRELGMQSMDSELARLVKAGLVTSDEAYMKAIDKKAFEVAAGLAPAEPAPGTAAAPAGSGAPGVQKNLAGRMSVPGQAPAGQPNAVVRPRVG